MKEAIRFGYMKPSGYKYKISDNKSRAFYANKIYIIQYANKNEGEIRKMFF